MAQDLYCWRCDRVVPMLTEPEWERMAPALDEAVAEVQRYRVSTASSLQAALAQPHGRDALKLYYRMTGQLETKPDAIRHHRLSLYGPPCAHCGKPLRTPRASHCVACGAMRAEAAAE
ncbi:hypothetical protein [Lysobacter sp. ESA13C]|uniref:hypothetical protein n=1 Tax=unclassified Lysobacter TaxID=2635362 RepID=UPI001CC09A0C|nr:hypothetical protein [Lysobacter sp. ESA13C]